MPGTQAKNQLLDAVIYAGFFDWGVQKKFGEGTIFEGRNEILLLGKKLKFVIIFQKYVLKLIKIWKIVEKIREKANIFRIFFNFLVGLWENFEI